VINSTISHMKRGHGEMERRRGSLMLLLGLWLVRWLVRGGLGLWEGLI